MRDVEYDAPGTAPAFVQLMTSPLSSRDLAGRVRHDPAMLAFLTDHEFETAYPENVRVLSQAHWTPAKR